MLFILFYMHIRHMSVRESGAMRKQYAERERGRERVNKKDVYCNTCASLALISPHIHTESKSKEEN